MKQTHFSLSIPEPCGESWEGMSPCASGKFCGSCQKTVIDFTNYSDAQLAAFFSGKEGVAICGHFYAHQIENKVFPFVAPAKKPYRTLAMAASVAALTILNFAAEAQEVQRETSTVSPAITLTTAPSMKEDSTNSLVIEGVVKAESGEWLLAASMQLMAGNEVIGSAVSDLDGNYRIAFIKPSNSDTVQLRCGLFGYTTELVQGIPTKQPNGIVRIDLVLTAPKKSSNLKEASQQPSTPLTHVSKYKPDTLNETKTRSVLRIEDIEKVRIVDGGCIMVAMPAGVLKESSPKPHGTKTYTGEEFDRIHKSIQELGEQQVIIDGFPENR